MAIRVWLLLCLLTFSERAIAEYKPKPIHVPFGRGYFPQGFVFGTAASAYQYEGAFNQGGKGPSIWDIFTHKHPEKIADHGSTGDVAVDSYHRYKEDVKIMTDMNVDAYRFSISWSRVIPTGKVKDGVNKVGIEYYNNLINLLLSKGVQPFVTIFHWDVPQALEDEYLGFLSPRITKDFVDFANLCFKEFGDRVKHWITLNEPWAFIMFGYDIGTNAPGRCSSYAGNCTAGDSSREPYFVAHNLLLSHAAAVKLYKEEYQKSQKGQIGITNICHWMVPLTQSKRDKAAAFRLLDFMYGWFMDPLVHGEYPKIMIKLVGKRLPKFTTEQSNLIKGSYDFIGVNYYTGKYTFDVDNSNLLPSYSLDSNANNTYVRDGKLIGPKTASPAFHVYPRGIRDLMLYTKEKYNNPTIYITENGMSEVNNNTLPLNQALKDDTRVNFYYKHLLFLLKSIKDGVNVKGYFAWSLLDNFEWSDGYTVRFGLNFVDYTNGLKRYPKHSAIWFKKFLA